MKLALIGGGGVRTVFFTESLVKYAKELGIDRFSIMDNNPMKLNIYGVLAKHIIETSDTKLQVELTTDCDTAVREADYIVTTMRVGEDEGRVKDELLALKHGVLGQETTGPGGFSFAMRSIPAMLKYCDAVERVGSKDALIFNFTNPAGLVTQAMHSYGYKNVVGICDGPTELKSDVCKNLGIPEANVDAHVYGLNHLSWLNKIRVDGVDVTDKILNNDAFLRASKEYGHFDPELIRYIEGIPSSYLYYFYYKEEAVNHILQSKLTRGQTIKDINDRMNAYLTKLDVAKNPQQALDAYYGFLKEREDSYMSIELDSRKHASEIMGHDFLGIGELQKKDSHGVSYEGYSGVAFNCIYAMQNDIQTDIPLNVENQGCISFLDDEDIIEITCRIDKSGIHPQKADNIPLANRLLIEQIKQYEKLTVQAIKDKSLETARQALMANPLVGSYSMAGIILDEYVKAFPEVYAGYR